MRTFMLTVLAAEKPFYEGECVSLVVPTGDGEYGILAHHTNMIAAIVPGTLRFTTPDGEEVIAAVSEGLVKSEAGQVLILVDTAERPEEIDEIRARRAQEEAREAMLQKRSILEYSAAQAKMARAINRLRVKRNQRIK